MAKNHSIIRYKFKADRDFVSVQFEGMSCPLGELKRLILDKSSRSGAHHPKDDYDLTIKDATTEKEYKDYSELIPRNTSVIVTRRIRASLEPLTTSSYQKPAVSTHEIVMQYLQPVVQHNQLQIGSTTNETSTEPSNQSAALPTDDSLTEDERIKKMVEDSKLRYLPQQRANFIPICHHCRQSGHLRNQCPLLLQSKTDGGSSSTNGAKTNPYPTRHHGHRSHQRGAVKPKNPTGLPKNDLIVIPSHIPGAFRDQSGASVVPIGVARMLIEESQKKADAAAQGPRSTTVEEDSPPEDLLCPICKQVYRDAVMTPCCLNNFCDECIRNALIEHEEHECPHCHRQSVAIDEINPNLFLRKHVDRWREERQQKSNLSYGSLPTQSSSLATSDQDVDNNKRNEDFDEYDAAILPNITPSVPTQPIQTGPIVIRMQPSTRTASPHPLPTTQPAAMTFEDGKAPEADSVTASEKNVNLDKSPIHEENNLTINDILSSVNSSETEKSARQTPPSQVAPISTILSSPPTTTTLTMSGTASLVPHHSPTMVTHLHSGYIPPQPMSSTAPSGLYPIAPNYYGTPIHVPYPGPHPLMGTPSMLPVAGPPGPPGLMSHYPGYPPYPGMAAAHLPPNSLNGYPLAPYDPSYAGALHPGNTFATASPSTLIPHRHPLPSAAAPLSQEQFYMKQRDIRRNRRSSSGHRSRSHSSSGSSYSSNDSRRRRHRRHDDRDRRSSRSRSHRSIDRKTSPIRDRDRRRQRHSPSPSNTSRRHDRDPARLPTSSSSSKTERAPSKQRKASPHMSRSTRDRERRRSPRPPPTIQQSIQRTIVYVRESSSASTKSMSTRDDRKAPSSNREHPSQLRSISSLSSMIQSVTDETRSDETNVDSKKRKKHYRERSESSHSKSRKYRRSEDRSLKSMITTENSTSIIEH